MSGVRIKHDDTSEAGIFARLWEPAGERLTPELARQVLELGFSPPDRARMHELAAKNNAGTLSAAEAETLDNYVRVGDLLALLQSKARKILKRSASPSA